MSESSYQEGTQALCHEKQGMKMSLFEISCYCIKHLVLAVALFFVSSGLIITILFLIVHLVNKAQVPYLFDHLLAVVLVLILQILPLCVFSILFIIKIIRRKRDTQCFLPTGEELGTLRERRNMPMPWWKKVAITTFFCWIAITATWSGLDIEHFRAANLIIPILMWLIAIIIAVAVFQPFEPKWTSPVIACLYFLMAIYGKLIEMANPQNNNWFFTAVMWIGTIIFTLDILQHSERRKGLPIVSMAIKTPPEAVSQ